MSFYNNVKGYVPLDQVNVSDTSVGDDVTKRKRKLRSVLDLFKVGQIVKCKVLRSNAGTRVCVRVCACVCVCVRVCVFVCVCVCEYVYVCE